MEGVDLEVIRMYGGDDTALVSALASSERRARHVREARTYLRRAHTQLSAVPVSRKK